MSDLSTALFWVGVLVLVGGLIGALAVRNLRAIRLGVIVAVVGVGVVILSGFLTGFGTTTLPPAAGTSGATVITTVPLRWLAAGETWNSQTNVLTVDVVYNYTSNYFAIEASNASTFNKPNYLVVPLQSARNDALNATFGFTYTVASVPVAQSIGASPQTYSIVGYKPATSTSSGVWSMHWQNGSIAGATPTQAAPTVTSGIGADLLGIRSFGQAENDLHISLAGGNSTSAPSAFYGALQVFTPYDMVLSISNSVPATITVAFIVIGEHA